MVSALPNVTIAYADFDLAQEININVNSAVFRKFFDAEGKLINSAIQFYPGDIPEPDIELTVDQTAYSVPAKA